MSGTNLEDIKSSFNKYLCIYIDRENIQNFDENKIRDKIITKAYENKPYYVELSKIIIDHLNKDKIQYKIRLFDIIDSLFKNEIVGNYVEQLGKYLFDNFKECYNCSDYVDRKILFKIYYTWKYIVPKNITEKIRKELNMDDFQEILMRENPEEIRVCDEYNQNIKKKMLKKAAEKRDDTKNIVEKENNEKNFLNKKRNSSNDNKSSDGNSVTKKKKKKKSDNNDKNNKNILNINNINNINKTDKNQPMIDPMNFLPQMPINVDNSNLNNLLYMKNSQNIINNFLEQASTQQQMAQIFNFLRSNPISNNSNNGNISNLINNFPIVQNPKIPDVSQIEINIFNFIKESNVQLDPNLRFFSSMAKFFNESVENKDTIKINCEYENIYNNPEYQQIRQYVNNSIFNNIKKNTCAICGFRTLFYNKLTEHLDIHFNINYLQKEGKNLFRKIGNNRNNWISGENNNLKKNNKNYNDEIGYSLSILLYYKNMMNQNIINVNNPEQENENEECMYPIDDNNIRTCELCGDEFNKSFSTKYHYWFYTEITKIKEDKTKLLVHKSCYNDSN